MTQNKLDHILENLHDAKASSDLKDQIMARALENPQVKPFWPLEKIALWIDGLCSPFPYDMGLKTTSLTCVALLCFSFGFMDYTPEMELSDAEIIASFTTDLDEMELY